MKLYRLYILIIGVCLACGIPHVGRAQTDSQKFVVVIDAGHGGHDPGALGRISKEKNINLNVALKLGRLIEQNCPDTKVIYTRKKDVFIRLDRRAEIANNAKADLFISIHTNSVGKNRTVKGASTWTLGLAKSDENLEVAKRENAVILQDSDHQTRYAGFNPNSAESYIIFEFMQDQYMSQSVHLASLVQKQFKQTCRRPDRGVHQAGFLVLKACAMPSILVELGFISCPEEEKYLNTEEGTSSLANGIYRAFLLYKNEKQAMAHPAAGTEPSPALQPVAAQGPATSAPKSEKQQKPSAAKPSPQKKQADELVFKVQFLTSRTPLKANDKRLQGLKDVSFYREGGICKYTCGASTNYYQVLRTRKAISSRYKDAFIVAFRNDEKTDIHQAIQEFKLKQKR